MPLAWFLVFISMYCVFPCVFSIHPFEVTTSKLDFSNHVFELAPDVFQHHQLELVQQEQLVLTFHKKSITQDNNLIVAWIDYPENPSIIDPQEQQSDYYDRYTLHPITVLVPTF